MFERIKGFITGRELLASERAKLVAYFTDISALIYHIAIFFVFLILDISPMFFYNILSISLFTVILLRIKTAKSYVLMYTVAALEVILHQILADYFLGSETCFHYFILLMGLLPFLVFRSNFKLATPFTLVNSTIFIIIENIYIKPAYHIAPWISVFIKVMNITITVYVIIFMIIIFTLAIFNFEANLKNSNQAMSNEIRMASIIQQKFFKQDTNNLKGLDVVYYSKPMAGVSGDIYDFYKNGNVLEGLGIFDISGHGISSGLVTMLVKNIIHHEFFNNPDMELWEIMNIINDRVIEEKGDIENYLTGIIARFKGKKLELCSAGHPMPIIYHHKTGTCEIIKQKENTSGAIGIKGFPVFYNSVFVDFENGDELILYSDGVTDIYNDKKEEYGIERFINKIENVADNTVTAQMNEISESLEAFKENQKQPDDITVIIVKKIKNAAK